MSLDQVHAFYKRTASDEEFRSRLQEANNKEECSQIVKTAGFDFTQQEFEEYTARLLETEERVTDEMYDLSEKELETVFGGGKKLPPIFPPSDDQILHSIYGLPISYELPFSEPPRRDERAWKSLF